MWVGVVALLKNMGIIEVIDWSIVWPVLLIALGMILKKYNRCTSCNRRICIGGMCGKAESHTCEGQDCKKC